MDCSPRRRAVRPTGPSVGEVDDLTALTTLVSHETPEEAARWYDLIIEVTHDARDRGGDLWETFAEEWPAAATAASFTSDQATAFLDGVSAVGGDPGQLLEMVEQHRDELVAAHAPSAAYPDESGWPDPAAGPATPEGAQGAQGAQGAPVGADRFAWVYDGGLVDRVALAFSFQPEHYETHLGPYLDQTWGIGWEQHPAEHKQAWLAQLLDGFLPQDSAGAPSAAETAAEDTAAPAVEDTAASAAEGMAEPAAEDFAAAQSLASQALAEALAELPEAAELPDEVIAQVLADVLTEMAQQ
jgi:hypothetical protein